MPTPGEPNAQPRGTTLAMDTVAISERARRVLDDIAAAARVSARNPEEVKLVAVSKRQPIAAIEAAYAAGLRCFGENYVQELAQKAQALAHLTDVEWHHIGRLQRNKANQVIRYTSCLHGVDRLTLGAALSRAATRRGTAVHVLVQVDLAGEPSKGGCDPDELGAIIAGLEVLPALSVVGLMAIPPANPAASMRPWFAQLRVLRDAHGGRARLPHLSMGMSADFREAIAEGATMVRVGSAIFGARE